MIVQSIRLKWGKECRGAPYAAFRNQFQKSYLLPEIGASNISDVQLVCHNLDFVQNQHGIKLIHQHVEYTDVSQWKVGCTEIEQFDHVIRVQFNYSDHCGKPRRYGSNFHYLSEVALELASNEYGRVQYNGRWVQQDTGDWIYHLHILNVVHSRTCHQKLFVQSQPVKEYKQLAILY